MNPHWMIFAMTPLLVVRVQVSAQDRATRTHDYTPLLCSPCCFAARRGPARACASRPTWPRGVRRRCASSAPLPVFYHDDHLDTFRWAEKFFEVEICAALSHEVCMEPTDFVRRSLRSRLCAPAAIATLPDPFTDPLPRAQVLWFRRYPLSLFPAASMVGAVAVGRLKAHGRGRCSCGPWYMLSRARIGRWECLSRA